MCSTSARPWPPAAIAMVILSQIAGLPMSWTVTLTLGWTALKAGIRALSSAAGFFQLHTVTEPESSPEPPASPPPESEPPHAARTEPPPAATAAAPIPLRKPRRLGPPTILPPMSGAPSLCSGPPPHAAVPTDCDAPPIGAAAVPPIAGTGVNLARPQRVNNSFRKIFVAQSENVTT